MKNQTMSHQSWQRASVTTAMFVVPTYGFGMRDVCSFPSHLNAETTEFKRHAAAIKATVKGLQPWSPPVT